ncbi:MAG: ribonuclease P protein component [Rudaea sp.]
MTDARALHEHPRSARLLRPGDFSALRKSSRRLATKYFHCEYRSTEAASARLGMAVSRRVSKHAVVRNRIRRQIRETFRLQRSNLPCFDVLIIARTASATQDNRVLRAELLLLWRGLASMPWSLPPPTAPLNEGTTPGTMRGPATDAPA